MAVAGSALGAYKLADAWGASKRKKELEKSITTEKDNLDKLNYDYLMQARNPKSEMVQKMSAAGLLPMAKKGFNSAAKWWYDTGPTSQKTQTMTGGAGALALLLMATSASVGTIAAKNYFDSKDVNRERLKIMRDTMRGVAASDAPPVVMPVMDPRVMQSLNRNITGAPPPVRKLTVGRPPTQLGAAETDPDDYSMRKALNV
jgi:hypothetical protein